VTSTGERLGHSQEEATRSAAVIAEEQLLPYVGGASRDAMKKQLAATENDFSKQQETIHDFYESEHKLRLHIRRLQARIRKLEKEAT